MSEIVHLPRIRTMAGAREVAGIYDCTCTKPLLVIDHVAADCGHCGQQVHRWVDGSLVGLQMTCDLGVLTIRLVDFGVDLHRCGDDPVAKAVDAAISEILAGQVVAS